MNGKLVRMLSTGRTGTKFLSGAFENQGYLSYHEDLYAGEPNSAITNYLHMLADLWKKDREAYYTFRSDFAVPYVRTVAELLKDNQLAPSPKLFYRWRKTTRQRKGEYVIHTAHYLTAATPLIEHELEKVNVESCNLIVFRNPLKTIHAIFLVEAARLPGQEPYRMRPASFTGDDSFLGAANLWANVYAMAIDQSRYYPNKKFHLMDLEQFSSDPEYAKQIFEFIGLDFDLDRFKVFAQGELIKPLRSEKVDSLRNSHLFHDPGFVFSESEIQQIYERVRDVVRDYGVDWGECVKSYLNFHSHEKKQIGFS